MKKKILMFLVCAIAVVGICMAAGEVVKRAQYDSCRNCNVADENRHCGKCNGFMDCKITNEPVSESDKKKNKVFWRYTYTCVDCGHSCYTIKQV